MGRGAMGRPPFLKDPVKKLFILEPKHVKILEGIRRKEKLSGCSEALRFILENYSFE